MADGGAATPARPRIMSFTTALLRYCGLWPAPAGESSSSLALLYQVYTAAVAVNVFANVALMSLALVTRRQDIKSFTESGGLILTILPCCFGVVSLLTKRKRYQDVIKNLQAFVSDGELHDAAGEKTKLVLRAVAEEKKIDVLYFSNVVLASFGYHLIPLLAHVGRRAFGGGGDPGPALQLPIKQMTLLDSDRGPWFAAEYVVQTVLGCGVIPTLVSLDLLTFALVKNSAHAFQALGVSLRDAGKPEQRGRAARNDDDGLAEEEDGGDEERTFVGGAVVHSGESAKQPLGISLENTNRESEMMKGFCQQHQEMLRCAQELVDLLRNWLFSHYLVASLLVCSLCYRLQVMEDMRDLFTQVSHLTVVMFRLFTLCYFSSELTHQSLRVADAAYSCAWHHLGADAKRCLVMIACRAQRPVVMKTGHFGDMSLSTFSALLQAAYSYFNIMNDFG